MAIRTLVLQVPAALAVIAGMALPASAQSVHRIVGPDGKVTFSDRAPPAAPRPATPASAAPTTAGTPVPAAASAASALPYELRQIAQRFPVTLYSSKDCAPCAAARNLLLQRGVPFTERSIESNDDIDALQRLAGSASLPFGTIGGQQLKGFSDLEWTQFLDAAGYPKTSQLPANYRPVPAAPLVAQRAEPARPATNALPQAGPPAAPPAPAPRPQPPTERSNPAGIRF